VVNLAARLCDEATGGQILLGPRAYAAIERRVSVEDVGPVQLKGLHKPILARRLLAVDEGVDQEVRPALGEPAHSSS
jgi:class 3 adenylate cyclase